MATDKQTNKKEGEKQIDECDSIFACILRT
jgi:hypothetical protein